MSGIEPRISVVIPTYNRAKLLRRALQSVIEQTFTDWEVLVVDNHSSDDTGEVVQSFKEPRIKLLKIHNNGIIAASRNMGIRAASGTWVALLDSDDWWTQDKLEVSVEALNRGNDVVYHDMLLVKNGWTDCFRQKVPTRQLRIPAYADLLMNGNAIVNSSVVIRRSLLLDIGGLSERPDLVASEDFECWLRLAQVTEYFFRLPGPHGYYWYAGENTSSAERTICHLTALAELHLSNYMEVADLPEWFKYSIGRAYFKLKNYQQVKIIFSTININNVNIIIFMKIKYMNLLIAVLSHLKCT